MKKIALHGSYFGDNFGDTLFVLQYINWLKEIQGYDSDKIILPYAGSRVRNLVEVSKKKGIRSLLSADKVVFIGGGYLGEPPTNVKKWSYRLIIRHLSVMFMAYLFRKPYKYIGVGAGPLSHKLAKRLTVFLLNKSEKVIVRDKESYDFLKEYGVSEEKILVTADSVLMMDESDVDKESRKSLINKYHFNQSEIRIGVHLPIPGLYKDKLIEILSDLKRYTDKLENYRLVIFKDFYKEDYDYVAHNWIKENYNSENITYVEYESPSQLIALLDLQNIVITTKLHCGIVANALGKYTLSISAHTKTERLYRQLELLDRNTSILEYKPGILIKMLEKYDNNIQYENVPYKIKEASKKNKLEFIKFIQD